MSQSVPFIVRRSVQEVLVSALLGGFIGLLAHSVGNNWQIVPAAIFLFIAFSLLMSYTRDQPHGRVAHFIASARQTPMGLRLMIITFSVTSLFAMEMTYDVIPDRFGFLELMLPVLLSYFLGDVICALFAFLLVSFFAYYIFVPPKFTLIFEPGPSFDSLAAFMLTCFSTLIWLTIRENELLKRAGRLLALNSGMVYFKHYVQAISLKCRQRTIWLPCALVLAYALFWSLYGAISAGNGLHVDSLEAYAWGREFRLGYFKHPPFWSWVAGVWFFIFPKWDFFFFFLSELNAALGLLGAWALLGRFCHGMSRRVAVILLLLTPFYQFNALRFNANTILLSLWVWTLYFFVRSIETRRLWPTILCGVFAGCAILSKYFGLILVGTCFFAALVHDNRNLYFRSYAPYLSTIVAFCVVLPHIIWLFHDGFQPLLYLMSKTDYPDQTISYYYFQFLFANILYFILPVVVIAAALFMRRSHGVERQRIEVRNGLSFMTTLAVLPFILTLIAGSVGHVSLTPPFGVPIFALVPLVLLCIARPPLDVSWRYGKLAVGGLMLCMVLAAPFIPYFSLRYGASTFDLPRREAVDEALQLWKEQTHAPSRFVAGSIPYNFSLVFRSTDNTSEFRDFNFKWSPWVTRQALDEQGLLAICEQADLNCLSEAKVYMSADAQIFKRHFARQIWGYTAPAHEINIIIIPPHH